MTRKKRDQIDPDDPTQFQRCLKLYQLQSCDQLLANCFSIINNNHYSYNNTMLATYPVGELDDSAWRISNTMTKSSAPATVICCHIAPPITQLRNQE